VRDDYALILGGAANVWLDVAKVESLIGGRWPGLVIAVNDVGCFWPRRLDYWFTLHAEKMYRWVALREERGHPMDGLVTVGKAGRNRGRTDEVIQPWNGGSSSLGAVALTSREHLNCSHVICCGVPMTQQPHFAETTEHDPAQDWTAYSGHRRGWERKMGNMLGWVKSVSGWTRDRLGPPTTEWLEGATDHG